MYCNNVNNKQICESSSPSIDFRLHLVVAAALTKLGHVQCLEFLNSFAGGHTRWGARVASWLISVGDSLMRVASSVDSHVVGA